MNKFYTLNITEINTLTSDSVEIKKIRDLNKPLLDLYKSKKARDRRLAEQDLL